MRVYRIASFDVEEHFRIEAASGLNFPEEIRTQYGHRMEWAMRALLEQLAKQNVKATFFIVGELARTYPALIREIHTAGHEVGSHSWDHRRIHLQTRDSFCEDAKKCKETLEQLLGSPIYGFRAPTFSVVRETAWALDVLAETGYLYDSSIFPVRHDRYGVPKAPRQPFLARGESAEILELPPLTLRLGRYNLPVAGGGYFRLFPLSIMKLGIRQASIASEIPSVAMLYFHPWEFDPDQPRLSLGRLARWRTYVGIGRTRARLDSLLHTYSFARAIDAVHELFKFKNKLPRFDLASVTSKLPA